MSLTEGARLMQERLVWKLVARDGTAEHAAVQNLMGSTVTGPLILRVTRPADDAVEFGS